VWTYSGLTITSPPGTKILPLMPKQLFIHNLYYIRLASPPHHCTLNNNKVYPFEFVNHRVRVVVAHFVTIRLALNSTFRLNCQQKFNFWAAGRWKFTSSSSLLKVRYVPSLSCHYFSSTLGYVRQVLLSTKKNKLTSSRSSSTAGHGVWDVVQSQVDHWST
jgi:hypothetical protein